jgi:hypothetical protein
MRHASETARFPLRITVAANAWEWVRDWMGGARRARSVRVTDGAGLRRFLETRASHVAQTSLYGYIRTRAGTRYPELFQNDGFIASLNIAKWQIWLACLSDLAVYAGGLLFLRGALPADKVAALMTSTVDAILTNLGTPPDAGAAFPTAVDRVRARLATTDWTAVTDDEQPYCESPDALVEWAPIVDELKQYDAEIVKNSVRFRWQEVRRDLRRDLDAAALAGHSG